MMLRMSRDVYLGSSDHWAVTGRSHDYTDMINEPEPKRPHKDKKALSCLYSCIYILEV